MTQDSRYLDFLSSLCVCSGRPIPPTQSEFLFIESILLFHMLCIINDTNYKNILYIYTLF